MDVDVDVDVDGNDDDKERGAVVLRGEGRVSLEDDRSSPPTHQVPSGPHPSFTPFPPSSDNNITKTYRSDTSK